jgi:actinin alpha
MAEVPAWERIQKKTFTKWVNTHMKREYGSDALIEDIIADWETGIPLMKLTVALYKENEKNPEQAVKMPTLKGRELEAKQRIQKITNLNNAIDLLKKAGVAMRGVSAENLCDHEDKDKPTILGMIFTIILDYAARSFGGASSEVKRALLEWVNKKTDGYERVNPPGVKNFTKDWNNGLAWCALIHRHRPDLLNYDECLSKSNAENLELAFTVADEQLGIPRLLDVEDMDVEVPDEKSVITYTMEYFLRFANEGLKEQAAKQAAEWLAFLRQMQEMKNEYERRARALLTFTAESRGNWSAYNFGETKEEALASFNALREFVTSTKPPQEGEKMDCEALFAEIQGMLKVNGLAPYVPPEDVLPEKIEEAFAAMAADQGAFASKVRENRFRFIEKKEDKSGEELEKQIEEAFRKFDSNNSGAISKSEFVGALMSIGIALKTDEEKDALFIKVAEGHDEVPFDSFRKWMISRLVVSLDDPESIKNAFKTLADGNQTLSEANCNFLTPEDREFFMKNAKQSDGGYDYNAFVSEMME